MKKRFKNQLLTVLPPEVFARWLPHLEWVDMPLGTVLYESSGKMTHVYFPEDCIVSLLFVLKNGSSADDCCGEKKNTTGCCPTKKPFESERHAPLAGPSPHVIRITLRSDVQQPVICLSCWDACP